MLKGMEVFMYDPDKDNVFVLIRSRVKGLADCI